MASTERWRRSAVVGLHRPDLTRLLLDDTIRLLDPGTTAELSIPRPRTEGELADLLWRFLGVRIPDVQVCAHHSTPWRAFCDAFFAVHPVSIWKGARGLAGKSYTLALLAWVEALTLRADVVILGGSGEQSERVHDYLRGFWMRPSAPAEALASDPSKKRTSLIWGNGITALLASQRSVRGPHPQRLRCLAGNTPVATPSGWRNIADLYAGDAVYSWHGGRLVVGTVTRAWCSGTLETIRLVTDAGSIRCTPDHRVLAADGRWVEAAQATVVQAVRRELWRDRAVGQVGAEVHGLLSRVGDDCEQAEMPDLRRQEEHVVRAVPVVPVRQPSEGGGPVRGLPREAKEHRVEAVSPVSLVVDERSRSGAVRAGQSYGARRSAAQPSGGSSGGTVGDVRPVVRAAAPDGTMGAGFLDRVAVVGGGGARGVLARQTGAHGHRREEANGPPAARIVCAGVAHGPDSQVVVAAYGARAEGPRLVVPVYDITVTHGTFIADGIVVHNCDEIDAMDWSILEAALGQPMGRGDIDSQTVLSSTHQNADGTMTRMLQMAAERDYSIHEWCWRETVEPHGWISQRAVDRKRMEMTAESWRVEVELGEPSPENRAMLQEKVDSCFSGAQRSVREGEYLEFEPPVNGASYATGADWARDVDFTEIVTLRADTWPMRFVAYERLQRRPMPDMVGRLDARLRRYPGEAAHDNTGGGNYLADWIEEPVEDVNLVGRQRGELFTNYIAAIEREEMVGPRIEPLYSQHKFCKNDDLFGSGHPPDGVVASALAYKASLSSRKPYRMMSGGDDPRAAAPGAAPAAAPQNVRDGLGRALDFLGKR